MTPQERDLLSRFLDELTRAQPGAKDAEAAAQIDGVLSANRDAAYVLVQHAILADAALHDAREEAAELHARLDSLERQLPTRPEAMQAAVSPGFLGALFGRAQPNGPAGASGPWAGGSSVPPYGYGAPSPAGPFSGGGGLGSFLRSAGTTAAGVAGGAFLFEGLSDMFGGGRREMFGDGGGAGFADMGGGGDRPDYDGGGDAGQFDVGSDV